MLDDILGEGFEYEPENEDEIGEDLEEGYRPDVASIHFVDPGTVLALIGLADKEILTKNEVREALGYDPIEA